MMFVVRQEVSQIVLFLVVPVADPAAFAVGLAVPLSYRHLSLVVAAQLNRR